MEINAALGVRNVVGIITGSCPIEAIMNFVSCSSSEMISRLWLNYGGVNRE
jgi:hypothetical protein